MLVATAIDHFCLFKTSEGLRPTTLAWYRDTLHQFTAYLGDPRDLADLTALDVVAWLAAEQTRGLAGVTVEGRYRALLAFCNWCERHQLAANPIGHGPTRRVARPKVDAPPLDYVTYAEYLAITDAIDLATWLDYRDWSLCALLFWTGLRRGELLALTRPDLDLPHGNLTLRTTKSRTARLAPFPDFVRDGLVAYLTLKPDSPALWPSYQQPDHALTASGLRQMLQRRCARARVRYLHPHLWRHGFAMTLLNDGSAQFSTVSALLGHSSVKVTEKHYARWLTGPLRREYLTAIDAITR